MGLGTDWWMCHARTLPTMKKSRCCVRKPEPLHETPATGSKRSAGPSRGILCNHSMSVHLTHEGSGWSSVRSFGCIVGKIPQFWLYRRKDSTFLSICSQKDHLCVTFFRKTVLRYLPIWTTRSCIPAQRSDTTDLALATHRDL